MNKYIVQTLTSGRYREQVVSALDYHSAAEYVLITCQPDTIVVGVCYIIEESKHVEVEQFLHEILHAAD